MNRSGAQNKSNVRHSMPARTRPPPPVIPARTYRETASATRSSNAGVGNSATQTSSASSRMSYRPPPRIDITQIPMYSGAPPVNAPTNDASQQGKPSRSPPPPPPIHSPPPQPPPPIHSPGRSSQSAASTNTSEMGNRVRFMQESIENGKVTTQNNSFRNIRQAQSSRSLLERSKVGWNSPSSASVQNGTIENKRASLRHRDSLRPAPPPPPRVAGLNIIDSCDLAYLKPALTELYKKHNPSKLEQVDSILDGFSEFGDAEGSRKLNTALKVQYGEDLTSITVPQNETASPPLEEAPHTGTKQLSKSRVPSVAPPRPPRRGQLAAKTESSEAGSQIFKLGKKTNKLFQTAFELVTSEYHYVVDLRLAKIVFLEPMKSKFGLEFCRSIFSVWEELLVVHEQILVFMEASLPSFDELKSEYSSLLLSSGKQESPQSLESISGSYTATGLRVLGSKGSLDIPVLAKRLDQIQFVHNEIIEHYGQIDQQLRESHLDAITRMVASLCDVMERMCHFLKSSIPYITNYPDALKFLEQLGSTNQTADRFLAECERNAALNSLHLRDYLIKPVQRVCKYPLLIREIHKNSENDNLQSKVKSTQDALVLIADQVNNMIKASESMNSEALQIFKEQLRPSDLVKKYIRIQEPSFRMHHHGDIQVKVAPESHKSLVGQSPLYGILLTDYFLIAHRYQHLLRRERRLQIKVGIRLEGVKEVVRPPIDQVDANSSVTFGMETNEGTWAFSVKGVGERDGWIADFAEALGVSERAKARRRTMHVQRKNRDRRHSTVSHSTSPSPSAVHATSQTSFRVPFGFSHPAHERIQPVISQLKASLER